MTGVAAAVLLAHRRSVGHQAPSPGISLPVGETSVVTTDDGADLAVLVAGPEHGPTVVLAHCWTGMQAIWAIVAECLVADGYRVVLYDQRGHGQSTNSDAAPSIAVLGHDLRAVLEAVDAHGAVLVGHSMGGMSIQSYAAEHALDFAERVRGVVLVATAAKVLGRTVPASAVERLMGEGRSEWMRRGALGRRVARGALGKGATRAHVELTLEGLAATTGIARAGFLTAMATMDLRDAGRILGTVPTRVLVGTRDTLTPPRLGRRLAGGIPGADLEVIPGAGHMLPLERPDEIVAAIRVMALAPG